MKKSENQNSRRSFLRKTLLGTAALSSAPVVLSGSYKQKLVLGSRSYEPGTFVANESYYKGNPVKWDPEAMRLI